MFSLLNSGNGVSFPSLGYLGDRHVCDSWQVKCYVLRRRTWLRCVLS